MSSATANIIILHYVCPGLGAVLSNLMCLSPVKDVNRAIRRGKLGDMNPVPWVFMFGQSLGWVTYGIVHRNLWLFFSDCLGLIIAFWLNISAIKLLYKEGYSSQERKELTSFIGDKEESLVLNKSILKGNLEDKDDVNETQRTIPVYSESYEEDSDNEGSDNEDSDDEYNINITQRTIPIFDDEETGVVFSVKEKEPMVHDKNNKIQHSLSSHDMKFMFIATLWFICISTVNLVPSITQESREITVSMVASFNLVLFYCAPLSTISNVLRKWDSSSIHIPTMIANTVNASFWAAYGYAISDWSIIIPNGLGCLFGFVQIFLSTCIPRKSKVAPPKMNDMKREAILRLSSDDNISFPVQLEK